MCQYSLHETTVIFSLLIFNSLLCVCLHVADCCSAAFLTKPCALIIFMTWKYFFQYLANGIGLYYIKGRNTLIYQPSNAHIISYKALLKHSDMFRSCQIIIRELCSLLKLYYSIHSSIRICKWGVVAAYHVVWECVVEQWLGVCRMLSNKRLLLLSIRHTPSHCSTTHSHTTWYAATTPHSQILLH